MSNTRSLSYLTNVCDFHRYFTVCVYVCGQSAEWASLGLIKLTDCDNQQLSVDIMTTHIVTETKQTIFSYPAYSTTTQTVFKLWWLWYGNAT